MIIKTFVFPQYIDRVKLSNSRRKLYYEKNKGKKKIPKKYSNKALFDYVNYPYRNKSGKQDRFLLTNILTGELVLSNPLAAGTAKYQHINANNMYAGIHENVRMLIVKGIKEYYEHYIKNCAKITTYPISIDYVFFTTIHIEFDLDNHAWWYVKTLHDSLKKNIIPDDNVRFIKKFFYNIVSLMTKRWLSRKKRNAGAFYLD